MKFYAQMYSVREDNEKDFKASLKAIAEMGFDGVELAGYYGIEARALKGYMDELGLETLSAHVSLDLLKDDLENQIHALKTLGAKYIVCPWAEINDVNSARGHAAILSAIGKRTLAEGLPLLYHNHDHEFKDDQGSIPLEVLFDAADDGVLLQQPDVYWMAYAGVAVADYLKKHEDRIKIVHLKQMADMVSKKNVDASNGIIDFKEVMALTPSAYHVYEQEFSDADVMEDMKKSLAYLHSL